VKTALRDGRSDTDVAAFLRFAVRHKELKHRVNEPGFVPASRSMSQIGG
jgi:cyclic pyranopterin phosphate synthase